MKIRDEQPGEAPAIAALIHDAFRDAPHADGDEAGIVDRLRGAGALSLSLVAEAHGAIAGHVAASAVTLGGDDPPGGGWFGIGPVAVRPALQRRGIGSALMRACLERLLSMGAKGAVLVGDVAFYGRFGFAPQPGLTVPRIPDRFVLALAFGADAPRGEITYHPAFGLG